MPPAAQIRTMFDRIASRYDLANRVISMGIDTRWRKLAVAAAEPEHADCILDVCCGTGDLTFALARKTAGEVVGGDFSAEMLRMARERIARQPVALTRRVRFQEADATQLPFADDSFDALTVAFGVRNVESLEKAFSEFSRVVRPGGHVVVMEFTRPANPLFRAFYGVWFERVVPILGGLVTGDREAYTYLPTSVQGFPGPQELASRMRDAGMDDVQWKTMGGGIVALHTARASRHAVPTDATRSNRKATSSRA